MKEMKQKVRVAVVIHGLILAFALLSIVGMAVPNCMQTVNFGEALWRMRIESEMLNGFLLVLVQVAVMYAYMITERNLRARISVAVVGILTGVMVVSSTHSPMDNVGTALLRAPLMPLAIVRGVPGFTWAEGRVMAGAFGLWVWFWSILALIDMWRETTTRRNLSSRSRAEGSA
jgi:hypothetical protein